MATDTSLIDYGMFSWPLDRVVHEEVLKQLDTMARRSVALSIHEDVYAVQDRVKRRYPKTLFSTETVTLIRDALTTKVTPEEDVPMPVGETWYGLLIVSRNDGRTSDAGFWVQDKDQRDARLYDLRNVAGEFEYIAIRKVTEYDRG